MAGNWVGMDAAIKKITAMAAKGDAAAKTVVARAAALTEATAKRNFQGSHAKGQPHVGGDKPNVVTGTLRRSIHHTVLRRASFGSWSSDVGPTVKYGRRVELGYAGSGGRGQQTTRAFPYFEPAAEFVRRNFTALATTTWRSIVR